MSKSDVSGIPFRWTDRYSWAVPRRPAVEIFPLANLATAVADAWTEGP